MPADAPRRPLLVATLAIVAAAMTALGWLSQHVERTPDELNYQLAGRVLAARGEFSLPEHRFQGPLILLGTQLTDAGGPATDDAVLRRARLGMLLFPALLLLTTVAFARQALGPRAGLVAAGLAATSPSLLAVGPLLSSDVPLAAMGMLAAWLTWRWLQRPTTLALLAVGAALGGLAATKYTAAIPIAGLALAVLAAAGRGFAPWWVDRDERCPPLARAARTLAALALAGAIALATLYACYLFAHRPCSAGALAELSSGALRSLAALPGGSFVLRLLPEPLVVGLDYQAIWAGRTDNGTFGDARGNHWAYYPVSMLVKTPEPLWLLACLGLPRLLAAVRGTAAVVVLPGLLLLAFYSATRSLQMGVRYVLPCVAAMWLVAAAAAETAWARRRVGRGLWTLTALVALAYVATGWPRFIGWFSWSSGGPANGFRLVADSNCDWHQRWSSGQDALRARHAQVTFLERGQGPRLGVVAAYCDDLKDVDPRDGTRCYHWLQRFSPIDHDGAAWLVFDVTPAAFHAAIAAGDDRAAEDLAVAHLMTDDVAAARAALDRVPPPRRGAAHAALQSLIEAIAAAGRDPAQRDACCMHAALQGHFELALALADRGPRANTLRVAALLVRTGRQLDAVRFVEAAGADGSRTTEEILLLASSLYDGGRHYAPDPMHALELMQRGPAPAADSPLAGPWRDLEAKVRAALVRGRRLAEDR